MIELISIHIPKTAGSSFFQLLKKVYGREKILKVYGMRGIPENLELSIFPEDDVRQARVVHGHFCYTQMKAFIEENQLRMITWLRDPVDRVISNYYYSMFRIREGKAKPEKEGHKHFSLLEYANIPSSRNMMSWFLEGSNLSDFFFIGLKESLQDDLLELGKKLQWPENIVIPHRKDAADFIRNNDCTTQFDDINTPMKEEIASLNEDDIRLYEEVKKIRALK